MGMNYRRRLPIGGPVCVPTGEWGVRVEVGRASFGDRDGSMLHVRVLAFRWASGGATHCRGLPVIGTASRRCQRDPRPAAARPVDTRKRLRADR